MRYITLLFILIAALAGSGCSMLGIGKSDTNAAEIEALLQSTRDGITSAAKALQAGIQAKTITPDLVDNLVAQLLNVQGVAVKVEELLKANIDPLSVIELQRAKARLEAVQARIDAELAKRTGG